MCNMITCDTEYDILLNRINDLESETDENTIIEILQDIGKIILENYVIKIDNLVIEPLRLEAYYYKKDIFEDNDCHKNELQINRFAMLYPHIKNPNPKGQKGGLDICLSKGDYYLSFLIKNSIVNNCYKKQIDLQHYIKNYCDDKKLDLLKFKYVLVPHNSNIYPILKTARIGVKHKFKDTLLAVFKCSKDYKYNFAKGKGKEAAVLEYMKNHYSNNREKQCIELYGSRSKRILEGFK